VKKFIGYALILDSPDSLIMAKS